MADLPEAADPVKVDPDKADPDKVAQLADRPDASTGSGDVSAQRDEDAAAQRDEDAADSTAPDRTADPGEESDMSSPAAADAVSSGDGAEAGTDADDVPDDDAPDDDVPDTVAAAADPAGTAAVASVAAPVAPAPVASPVVASPVVAPVPVPAVPVPPAPVPPAVVPVPPDPADAARRRLLGALRPRPTRSQLLAAAICAVLGFSIVVQARQSQVQSLASLRQSDLITVLDNVTQETARLDAQAASLEQTLAGMQSSTERSPAALKAAQERLDVLGVLAGTVQATGPGVEIDISDPKAIVNASDMLETVQELRDAGAEAMQIGTVRVVASTAFVDRSVDDRNGLMVDDTMLTPPYKLLVIGDPQTLGAAMEIPGGVLEVLRNKGGSGTVRQQQLITITALRMLKTPQYAHPAPAAGP